MSALLKKQEASMPGLTPTLNKMGYMFSDLTSIDLEFINFCEESKGPALEIGAAYGDIALKIAHKGVEIVANDLEKEHLSRIEQRALGDASRYITTVPGRFPDDVNFEDETFTAVLASNVFHYLDGDDITRGINKIFHWLKPNGRVYVVVGSPYAHLWHEFIPFFEEKIRQKKPWPGYVTDFSIFKNNHRFEQIPDFMHFFEPTILSLLFEEAGFCVKKAKFCARPQWPADLQLDGRESVGLVAAKTFHRGKTTN